jgi:hypothetical protein
MLALPLLLAACGGPSRAPALPEGSRVAVMPVRNLAGVPLKVPELYLGDAGGSLDIPLGVVDIPLAVEAAMLARVRMRGYEAADGAEYELHGAVTEFDALSLRSKGRVRLGVAVMVVDRDSQQVVREGHAEQDYQLLPEAPDRVGLLGEQRFIRDRLEAFIESLTSMALHRAGI